MRERLLKAAREAAANAYCPYSGFRVGAAVMAGGEVFTGVNVENASLGLSLCAERAALAAAITAGKRDVTHLALASPDAAPGTLTPCGACRQWLAELAPEAEIHLDGDDQVHAAGDLLPGAFSLKKS